jgi:hypothetical protein
MVAPRSFLKGKKGAVVAPFFFWFLVIYFASCFTLRCCIHMLTLADFPPWPF